MKGRVVETLQSNPFKIMASIFQAHDVGVLGLEIEKALLVRSQGAVTHAFANHHRTKARLQRVHCGGPHAAAGGAAGNQHRIDAARYQPGNQVGAEKAGGVLLHKPALAGQPGEPGIELDFRCTLSQGHHALLLECPDAGVLQVGIVIGHGGIDDGQAPGTGGIKQLPRRSDLRRQVGAQHHGRVGEATDHVDHQNGRPLAEPDAQAKASLAEEVLLARGGHVHPSAQDRWQPGGDRLEEENRHQHEHADHDERNG